MIEDDFWDGVLKPYETDPVNAFILAQCFWLLRRTLTEGPDGVQQVIRSLENGIRDLYPYTDVYQASYQLYERLVSGEGLSPHLDPREIVKRRNSPEPRGKEQRVNSSKEG